MDTRTHDRGVTIPPMQILQCMVLADPEDPNNTIQHLICRALMSQTSCESGALDGMALDRSISRCQTYAWCLKYHSARSGLVCNFLLFG